MQMNETQSAIVSDFCKSTKASKTKTLEMLAAYTASMPEMQRGKPGRKTTGTALEIRDALRSGRFSGQSTTSVKISAETGYDLANVNNALRYVMGEGVVKIAGKEPRQPGRKGKRAILWQFK